MKRKQKPENEDRRMEPAPTLGVPDAGTPGTRVVHHASRIEFDCDYDSDSDPGPDSGSHHSSILSRLLTSASCLLN